MEVREQTRWWSSLGPSRALHIDADDLTHASEARRVAQHIAAELGMDETAQGEAAIVATECATNLARHGGGGQLHLRAVGRALEIVAVDAGPGMPDVDRCLADGFSTGGSAGTGLGAIKRLASFFDIHSTVGRGTVVMARLGAGVVERHDQSPFVAGAAWLNAPGELECGDACTVGVSAGDAWVFVADGLGHGGPAAHASASAVSAFQGAREATAAGRIDTVHQSLRPTRGAAVAATYIDRLTGMIEFAGIGNIAGSVRSVNTSTGLVSMSGIAGHQVRKIQPFSYRWPHGGVLVLHSDGVQTHWSFDGENGLLTRHPTIIASVLLRNFIRGRDDAMVVVVKERTA